MKHTKEPWQYNPDERNFEQPFNYHPNSPLGPRMMMSLEDFDYARERVNSLAGLNPAAVPELVKAVQKCYDEGDCGDNYKRMWAALAKAKGSE